MKKGTQQRLEDLEARVSAIERRKAAPAKAPSTKKKRKARAKK